MPSENKSYPITLSDKAQKEWITGCPIRISRVRLIRENEAETKLFPEISVCGDFKIKEYTIDIELTGARRESVGRLDGIKFEADGVSSVSIPFSDAVYAYLTVMSVTIDNGEVWKNESGTAGAVPKEQEIYWQTDPLYEAVQVECTGVTEGKYRPDTIDGGWRCACGGINLEASEKCGSCGCRRDWLNAHLSTENLEKVRAELADKSAKDTEKIKKKREYAVSDKTKMIIILSVLALAVFFAIRTFTTYIPNTKYNKAVRLAEEGKYDEAINEFNLLEGYRDSREKAALAAYNKAQQLTGMDEVNVVYTNKAEYLSITEDGILSFKKDKYKGSWDYFVIPDVVDGIVVRELDRNFFINCSELVSVKISDCVEVLGEQCFYNCSALEEIEFGKSVKTIMPRAFINCTALTEIEIPDTVTYLGLRAFNNCINLNKAILGAGITKIESYTFSLCMKLERITLLSPVSEIGEYAFSECAEFKKVHCRFDEAEWKSPAVEEGNEAYMNAELYFGQ